MDDPIQINIEIVTWRNLIAKHVDDDYSMIKVLLKQSYLVSLDWKTQTQISLTDMMQKKWNAHFETFSEQRLASYQTESRVSQQSIIFIFANGNAMLVISVSNGFFTDYALSSEKRNREREKAKTAN